MELEIAILSGSGKGLARLPQPMAICNVAECSRAGESIAAGLRGSAAILTEQRGCALVVGDQDLPILQAPALCQLAADLLEVLGELAVSMGGRGGGGGVIRCVCTRSNLFPVLAKCFACQKEQFLLI